MSSRPQFKSNKDATSKTNMQFGTVVNSVYGERTVRVFGVHEPELDSVSYVNTKTIISFSIGSFCLQNIISDVPLKFGSLLNPSVLATLFFFSVGLYEFCNGKNIIKKIKGSHDKS